MKRLSALVLGALGLSAVAPLPARAEEIDDLVDGTMIVYGDDFARWNKTRWNVETELVLPNPLDLQAERNLSFRAVGLQIRTVIACEKDWQMRKTRWEVHCDIEEIGLQAAAMETKTRENRREQIQSVLAEIDARLTGANVQLQVSSDGRVTNVDLEGMPEARNARERLIQETLRLVLYRVVVGFDLKLRKNNDFRTGQWVEYHSPLMSMPALERTGGTSFVVHRLDPYRGYWVVQSKGKGQITAGEDRSWKATLDGVSLFDPEVGFMVERVWALDAVSTGTDLYGTRYWHCGRIHMLGKEQKVEVGPTRQIAAPGVRTGDLPRWVFVDAANAR